MIGCSGDPLLAVAPLLAALGLGGEILARAWNGAGIASLDNFIALTRRPKGLRHDSDLGWILREGFRTPDGRVTFGRDGVRRTGGTESPRDGGVIVVGDSFTVGPGLSDGETWPAALERGIGRPVINGACGGYGIDQMVLRAERLTRECRPAALIMAILDVDALRCAYAWYGNPKPWFRLDAAGGLVLEGSPVPDPYTAHRSALCLPRRILGHSHLVHSAALRVLGSARWIGPETYARVHSDATAVDISCALMSRLASLGTERGFPILTVMLHNAEACASPSPSWFATAVLSAARSAGLATLDMFGSLHAISTEDGGAFDRLWQINRGASGSRYGYPSAEGAERIAGEVEQRLAALGIATSAA